MGTGTPPELALQAEVRRLRARIAELENRKEPEWLRTAIDSISDAVLVTDAAGNVVFMNPVAAQLTGWTEDEGSRPGIRAVCEDVARAVQNGETVLNRAMQIERPDGTRAFILLSASPVRDAHDKIAGSAVAIRDITELKRAEDALKESEAVLRTFFDSPGVLRGLVDLVDGQIVHVSCNEFAAQILDVDRESIAGRTATETGETEEMIRVWTRIFDQSLLTGEPVTLEYARPCRHGGARWLLATACYLGTGPSGHARFGYTAVDLTDRKRAEEQVSRSRQTLSELVERAPFGIYVVDSQFRIAHMNTASQAGAFRNVRPVIGRDFAEAMRILWDEPVAAGVIAAFRHTLETGEPYHSPRFFNPRHDVEAVEGYEWELHRMMLSDGQYGVICYYFDSTKLLEAEAELRRIAQFPDQDPSPVLRVGPGGRLDYANAAARSWLASFGAPEDQPLPRGLRILINRAAPGGGSFEELGDGSGGTYLFTAVRPAGEVYANVYGLDITKRKRAEEKLFEAHQRLEALMEALPVGVSFSDDPTCQRITGNPAVLSQYEMGSEDNLSASAPDPEAPGRQLRQLREGREVRDTELPLQLAVSTGAVVPPMELEVHLPSGRTWFVEASGAPVRDRQGNVVGGVAVTVDITERKRSEQRLREAQKLESLGLLAGGVAHDFNNLLIGVVGNASLAQEMLPPNHPAIELMQGVLHSGEQAAHLTRQMLAYSGKGQFLIEALNLSALIPDMVGLVQPSISKKVAVHLDLPENLPLIEADRGQIQQVFMNLALNAAEAIGSHDGVVTVRAGVQEVDGAFMRRHAQAHHLKRGEYVFLEVHDTGCGMDDNTRAKIFDPFFSTKFTGRGLGLAAVSGIIRGHKGAIIVTSTVGQGSTFTVLFPAAIDAREQPAIAAPSAALQGSGTVLVVDDEAVVRSMAKRALERHGYTVLLADGGPAAIDVFKRHSTEIVLVLLDLSMPGMSGHETLPELRKIQPEAKVVISSGYSEAETMALFRGQSVSGFVQKPYTSLRLAERVKLALA